MARQLTYAEWQRYQWLVDAAGGHAGRWLGTGGAVAGAAASDVHVSLRPEQRAAMERLLRRSEDGFAGRPWFGSRGPIRPGRARALRSGLESIVADRAAAAAPPATNDVPAADGFLDIGLRTAFAEEQVAVFAQGSGLRPPRLFRSRDPQSQVFATAARRLVRDIAARSGTSQGAVMRHLLNTPPNLRFDAAAGLIGGRRGTGGMASGQQDYAHAAMALAMRNQFQRLGPTASGYNRIGQRLGQGWKKLPFLAKAVVVVVAAANLQVTIPALVIAGAARTVRAVQRSERLGYRLTAGRRAGAAMRAADAVLRNELTSGAARLQPFAPYQQSQPANHQQQQPAPAYNQQRPAPAYSQQRPAPGYGQQMPAPTNLQQGPAPAFPQQGQPPVYAQQGQPPVYPRQTLPPGFAQQGPAPADPQQTGGQEGDTVRLTPGWNAATTGSAPLQSVSGDATAPVAGQAARPGQQQRGQETSRGRHAAD